MLSATAPMGMFAKLQRRYLGHKVRVYFGPRRCRIAGADPLAS